MNLFAQKLSQQRTRLRKSGIEILQVNMGKLCNLACVHCHVEAGPAKTKENMDRETAEAVVRFMDYDKMTALDLTGGAPELNPHFRYLVREARKRSMRVLDRCNLTVFYEKQGEDLPAFLADQKVEVIASLPCYTKDNVDKQRGNGTFTQSISALRLLNDLGYAQPNSGLRLNLVYNPVGPHLPPPQEALERDYKVRLADDFGIVFDQLYTITNMPITRYAKYLKAFGQYDEYVTLLINSFNPHALDGVMCRNMLSVGWDGSLYDCDFNQMLGLRMGVENIKSITPLDVSELNRTDIVTGNHCFACTAGSGSSCQGSITGQNRFKQEVLQ